MFGWKSFALLALFDGALAVTAPNFPVLGGQPDLNVTFGGNNVSPPGELIPRPATVNPPNITTPVWTSANHGIIMMVDTEVPRNNTRVQLLHWLVSGVTISTDNQTLSIPSTAEASYLQPSPPVGDVPHLYTILLFSQPSNFTVPAEFQDVLESRVFFNSSAFVKAAGLSSPLAANYIQVQNTSGTATQTFPPATTQTGGANGSNTSTPAPFPGGAVSMSERAWLMVAGPAVLALMMALFL